MNEGINLIPLSYRARLKRNRLQRSITIGLGVLSLAIGLAGWSLHLAAAHNRAELANLRLRVAEMRALAADAQALEDGINEIRGKLQAQQRLQYPVDVSAMLATLCALMPDSVTLDSMELRTSYRSLEPTTQRSGRSSTPARSEENRQLIMICEMTGVARSDLDVADFVGRLTDHPLYQEVALDYSRPITVREVSGRTFRISCNVDLSRFYQVEEHSHIAAEPIEPTQVAGVEASDGA